MSWSFTKTGRPAEIIADLGRYGEQLTGQSRAEFDAARPHLAALIGLNEGPRGGPVLDFAAWGSATHDSSTDPPRMVSQACLYRLEYADVAPGEQARNILQTGESP